MSETSKKLTVAFGTFSCTLQGFDDPFPIMKRVVDYFQSLAAADPTFGSEPQRPDTDQLRSIAEENTGTSVDAELVGDELILSQPAPAEETFEQKMVVQDVTETVIADEPVADEADAPQMVTEPAVEDVIAPEPLAEGPDQVWLAAQNWTAPAPAETSAEVIAQNEEDAAVNAALAAHTTGIMADMAAEAAHVEPIVLEQAAPLPLDLSDFDTADVEPEPDFAAAVETEMDIFEEAAPVYEDVAVGLQDWEAEFAAEVEEDKGAPLALGQSDELLSSSLHTEEEVQVEDAALERILAALRSRLTPGSKPVADVPEAIAPETPAAPEAVTAQEDPAPAPLRLGFGDMAGLDATRAAETDTVDHRKQAEDRAFDAMLGSVSQDDTDFAYTPDPLVLTPAQQVVAAPQEPEASDLRRFAKAMGAASVTDLIEASAAYVTLVDGRPNFSRREVLGLLDELTEDRPLTQETRIKSFGTLLRGGRFKRAENGEFALADTALTEYEMRKTG